MSKQDKEFLDKVADELLTEEEEALGVEHLKGKVIASMAELEDVKFPNINLGVLQTEEYMKLKGNGIFNDRMFKHVCERTDKPMIEPFVANSVKEKDGKRLISYGLSSFGYDMRVSNEFMVLSLQLSPWKKVYRFIRALLGIPVKEEPLDPKNFPENKFKRVKVADGEAFIMPPHSVVLAHSVDYFRIPKDCHGICVSKSTYARVGVSTLCTPLESGWEGYLTLEFHNGTDLPVKMYAGEGSVQLIVFRGNLPEVSYADRSGKYMHQPASIVTPIV